MRRVAKPLLIALALVILLSSLYFLPIWQVERYKQADQVAKSLTPKELADLENKFRGTLASALGGLGLLVGLWFTLQQVRLSSRNASAAEENVRISAKSKNLDRITSATNFMSSDLMSKKVAGVTILGSLALESREDVDAITLALLHYLEERIPFRSRRSELPSDVLTALKQLSAIRKKHSEHITEDVTFRGFDLCDAELRGLYFDKAIFRDLNLENTTFTDAVLKDVLFLPNANTLAIKFYRCELHGGVFSRVNLTFSHFSYSRCEDVIFDVKDLEGAALNNSTFVNCNFSGVSFKNASLWDARFDGCVMYNAQLEEANALTGAQLTSSRSLYGAAMPRNIEDSLRKERPSLFLVPKILRFEKTWAEIAFFADENGIYRTGRNGKKVLRGIIPAFDGNDLNATVRALETDKEDFYVHDVYPQDMGFHWWQY